jgi:hypothetical protein
MTKNEIILNIEEEIKQIFAKDNITKLDVFKANKLLNGWKILTNHKSDTTPVLQTFNSGVLDNDPMWDRNLIINYEISRER